MGNVRKHRYPTRAEVRAFGKRVSKGGLFTNRWQEHGHKAGRRVLRVIADVRSMPFFILEDEAGKTVWMRSRTLMRRYLQV